MNLLRIYNCYLKTIATYRNRPYRYRKSLEGLEESIIMFLEKIEAKLQANPEIDLETFLIAPYEINNKKGYYDLEYYTQYNAITLYVKYQQKLINESCDNPLIIKDIKDAYKFILQFCVSNKITSVKEYFDYKNQEFEQPVFIEHLKHKKINVYPCIHMEPVLSWMKKNKDIIIFCFSESFYNKLPVLYSKLTASNKAKKLCQIYTDNIDKALSERK